MDVSLGWVKPQTIKLIVATSKLDMQLSKVRTKKGLFGLRIFCLPAGLFQWVIVMAFNTAFHNILGKL